MSIIPKHGFDIDGPTTAPIVEVDRALGNMLAGPYRYKITYINRYGETLAGPASDPITPLYGSVALKDIPVHPLGNVISRRIYRTAVGGSAPFRLVGVIGDNYTTTYTDIAADFMLGAVEPINNFAPSVGIERGWTVLSRPAIHPFENLMVATGNDYSSATRCSQTGEYFLVSVPVNLNGIILPPVTPDLVGMVVVVKNMDGANELNVFPDDLASQINGGGAGVPRPLQPGVVEEFLAVSITEWKVITSSGDGSGVTSIDGGATGLTPTLPSTGAVSIGGTLNVSHGGTGITVIPNGAIIYGNGTAPVGTTVGSTGQFLVSGGTSAPTWSGTVTFNGTTITGVPNPINGGDIVNKTYVDALTTGFNVHAAVQLATTTALTVVYNNGAGGVGATLTNNGALAALQIDSTAAVVGQRVLVKDQATQQQNGIYTVTDVGSGATAWVLTRATDFDNSPPGEVVSGDFVFVEFGTVNGATGWVQTYVGTGPGGSIDMGTDPLTFTQFSSAGGYLAGTGLNLLGNTFNNTGVLSVSGGTTGLTFVPSTGNAIMSGILSTANGGTGTTSGINVVLDNLAVPTYPNNLTSGVWYGTGTKTAGNSGSVRIGNSSSALGLNAIAVGQLARTGSGSNNITIGPNSGIVSATGANNIGVGGGVFTVLTSGDNNVSVGVGSLAAATTASNCVAFGYNALSANSTVNSITAIGHRALNNFTSGSENTAIGFEALSITVGAVVSNTAVGYQAITQNTAGGWHNTAVGSSCMRSPSTYNTAVGSTAMYNCNGASINVAIGSIAMFDANGAYGNIAVGHGSLAKINAGFDNTAIGHGTLGSMDGASSNTAVGSYAGAFTTGFANVTFGTNNIFIGIYVKPNTTTIATSIGIGNNSVVNNNSLVIGDQASAYATGTVVLGHNSSATQSDATAIGSSITANVAGGLFLRHNLSTVPAAPTSATLAGFKNGTNELVEFPAGANGQFLSLVSGVPTWSALGATPPSGAAGGDLSGTYPNPNVAFLTGSAGAAGSGLQVASTSGANSSLHIGHLAAFPTGVQSVGIGRAALNSNTGTANTALGFGALGVNAGGGNNTAVGAGAGAALVTGSGNVLIGNAANVDTAARNNAVVLGNGITSISAAGAHDGGLYSQHYSGVVAGNAAVWVGNELVESVSSQRYKENIRLLGDVSEKFMKLEPVRYVGRDDQSKSEQIGLIAESVEKVFPEFVVYKEFEGEGVRPHGLSYDRMVAVLIQQVQKLTEEVEALKAERK